MSSSHSVCSLLFLKIGPPYSYKWEKLICSCKSTRAEIYCGPHYDSFVSRSSDTSKLLTFNTQIMPTASKLHPDGRLLPVKACQAVDISCFLCACFFCFFFLLLIKHAWQLAFKVSTMCVWDTDNSWNPDSLHPLEETLPHWCQCWQSSYSNLKAHKRFQS